jgi:V8-like Glu-specific endopeptidase
MTKNLCLVVIALMFLQACGRNETGGELFRIIGDNDLVSVDASFGHSKVVKSIGRLRVGCTVTHVGQGVVVTAGHCFFDSTFEGKVEHKSCNEGKFEVEWGVLATSPSYLQSRCTEIIAAEYRGGVDYTIFRVSPYPATSVAISDRSVSFGDRISILSHPRRRPMEWSGYCAIKSLSTHQNSQFGYECDTDGGSSGAAVLNENFEIVGIHNFYNSMDNLNGGTAVNITPLSELASGANFHEFRRVRL